MKKHIIAYGIWVVLLVAICYVAKSQYFYHPYPNLIEYLASSILLLYTLPLLIWRKNRRKKFMLGMVSIVALFSLVNALNYALRWHPIQLSLPFSDSQSFHVGYEPYAWKQRKPHEVDLDTPKLNQFYAKLESWDRLRALLVVQDDQLIIEKYFKGNDRYEAFNVHSITKTVTSALTGIGIDQGILASESEKVLNYFPEYRVEADSFKQMIELRHLLSMKGGFAYWDALTTPRETLLEIAVKRKPGECFKYFSGSHMLLSAVLTKASSMPTAQFAEKNFFEPLGIHCAFWRKQEGYDCGGSESYFVPRDLARIGQLYLNRGQLDGRQIISEEWIDKSLRSYTDSSKYFRQLHDYKEVGYGYGWWLLEYKDRLIYAARGKGGQYILLLPETNTVIVIVQEWNLKKKFGVENRLLCELLSIFVNQT